MQSSPKVEDLPSLTSLRFAAAMMIVVHHASLLFPHGWAKVTPSTLVHGVSFFFVLSGFILTHVYNSKPLHFATFVRARFARLWPVHVLSLCLLAALVPAISVTFDGTGIFNKWVVLGFNLALLHSVFPVLAYTFSWNAVSWSISTEMFFYLAFPLLIVNIRRTWHWKVLAAALLALGLILFLRTLGLPIDSTDVHQATATFGTYPNPAMRGLEFCTGMATWVLWDRHLRGRQWSLAVWTVLEFAALALCAWWLLVGYFALVAHFGPWALLFVSASSFWVFALLIAVFAGGHGVLGKVLSIRPLIFLGEISFSIYMLHQVLMKVFLIRLEWADVPEVVYFGVLFAAASASYLLVEKPGQRFLAGTKRSPEPAART